MRARAGAGPITLIEPVSRCIFILEMSGLAIGCWLELEIHNPDAVAFYALILVLSSNLPF